MRTVPMTIPKLVCVVLALTCLPSLLSAQVVSGILIEEGSGDPLEGVLVVLVDAGGNRVAGSLTGPHGRFSIQAPSAARYSVRAERIGYVSANSSPFELGPGETRKVDLVASVEAIQLEGITAAAESRCDVRPREGLAAQRLWEEARKALTATEVTRAEALVRYRVLTYEREIDPETGRVVHERSAGRAGWGERPFASVPVEKLWEHGFVVISGDTATYYGPDAEVLLSDEFLDTHCFRPQASGASEDGLIGLAFEPVSRRRIPDIRGVLWIDQETGELRHLEFRFTWLPVRFGLDRFGGRLEFERLPTGTWIVRRWRLRMPLIGESMNWTRGQTQRTVAGIREEGGEVTEITSNRAGTLARAAQAVLRGEVVDSVADAPLAGAEVFLSGTQYRTRTGPDGRFSLEVPSEGEYTVAFSHPRLRSLAILAPSRGVRLRRGEVTTTELAIPSLPTLLGADCPDEAAGAPVVGVVRDSLTGEPLAGVRVVLAGGAGEPRETVTSGAGSYLFCDVPSGETLTLTAGMLGRTGQPVSLTSAGAGVRRDLSVALVRAVAVRGQVRDFETSQPISAAVVQLEGADLRQVTDREGRFTFEQVTPGSYVLQIRHLGYGTHRDSLKIGGSATAELEVRLPSEAIALQGVTVTVSARPPGWEQGRLRGFAERKALGRGHFISQEELETRSGARLTDLLREVPGVRVVPQGGTAYTVRMARQPTRLGGGGRGGDTESCPPTVYIDGMRWNASFEEIQMSDVQALEVYRGASEIPAEFGGSDARCGVIVLWSK